MFTRIEAVEEATQAELDSLERSGHPPLALDLAARRLTELRLQAARIPGGYILKREWRHEDGMDPERVNFNYYLRPYVLGHHDDDTNSSHAIHIVGMHLLAHFGIDYGACLQSKFPLQDLSWMKSLRPDGEMKDETLLPQPTMHAVKLFLFDVMTNNYGGVRTLLCDMLESRGHDLGTYWRDIEETRRAVADAGWISGKEARKALVNSLRLVRPNLKKVFARVAEQDPTPASAEVPLLCLDW